MTKKNIQKEVAQITSFRICLMMKFNPNTTEYVLYKYRDDIRTEDEWKRLFKKDGLNF